MLSGLQPLKLLHSTISSRHNAITSKRSLPSEDSSDDEDDTSFASPPPSPQESPVKTNESLPPAPVATPEVTTSPASEDAGNQNGDCEISHAPESDTPAATMSPANDDKPATQAKAVTPTSKTPKAANTSSSTPVNRKKRLSPFDKTTDSAMAMAQQLATLTETVWKSKQDALKTSVRELKMKQEELKKLEQHCEELKKDTVAALQQKREATSQVKKLSKQFEKCRSLQEKQKQDQKDALQAAKRKLVQDHPVEEGSKRKRTQESKGPPRSGHKKRKPILEESSDSEAEAPYRSDGEDDDSDWEGAGRAKRAPESTGGGGSSSCQRSRRASRGPTFWTCDTCTFAENPLTTAECELCQAPKTM